MTSILPTALHLRGRRAVDDVAGVALTSDFLPVGSGWALRFRIDLGDEASGLFPRLSDWYVIVGSAYPEGAIGVYPAAAGGITATYPHQTRNDVVSIAHVFRAGKLCLDEPSAPLGRVAPDGEPRGVDERLRWHLQRAVGWARAAAHGQLLAPGSDFELPASPRSGTRPVVVVKEDEESFATWTSAPNAGTFAWAPSRHLAVVCEFSGACGFRHVLDWGAWGARLTPSRTGRWIRFPQLPVLDPWQAPATWNELQRAAAGVDVPLDEFLRPACEALRHEPAPILLIGAPIPRHVARDPVELHWQALLLPRLMTRRSRGARLWPRDKEALNQAKSLNWTVTENLAQARQRIRGQLDEAVRKQSFLIVGAGAVGSQLCELLVREGIVDIGVVDGDRFAAGNLARHALDVESMGEPKAAELAQRLARIAPGARVRAVINEVAGDPAALVADYDVIVDTTGADDTLVSLARTSTSTEKVWASLSVSFGARHLFMFVAGGSCFPMEKFRLSIEPILDATRAPLDGSLREGPGCWHPLFLGRASDIAMLVGAAVRGLESLVLRANQSPKLIVLERAEDEAGVVTVQRRKS